MEEQNVMTLEQIKQEMIKRGANKAQAESKTVHFVLDVLADSHAFVDVYDAEKRLSDLKSRCCLELGAQENELRNQRRRLSDKEFEVEEREKEVEINEKALKENVEYIKKWCETLANCETQEGRDAMRIAQLFINSTSINTKYDNTAFIIGLASILSSGKMQPIDELKKINPSLTDRKMYINGKEYVYKDGAVIGINDIEREGIYKGLRRL